MSVRKAHNLLVGDHDRRSLLRGGHQMASSKDMSL